ncbi:hypothetical protein PcaKH35_13430 [Parageobacillus caldoxylosilyticus]|nr:hypothetical protein PcaKH35_13430 [Parageobacillus caldoxylosilyticus]
MSYLDEKCRSYHPYIYIERFISGTNSDGIFLFITIAAVFRIVDDDQAGATSYSLSVFIRLSYK